MNNEVREIIGNLVVEIERSTDKVFKIVQKDPSLLENDQSLIKLLDIFASTLELYKDK